MGPCSLRVVCSGQAWQYRAHGPGDAARPAHHQAPGARGRRQAAAEGRARGHPPLVQHDHGLLQPGQHNTTTCYTNTPNFFTCLKYFSVVQSVAAVSAEAACWEPHPHTQRRSESIQRWLLGRPTIGTPLGISIYNLTNDMINLSENWHLWRILNIFSCWSQSAPKSTVPTPAVSRLSRLSVLASWLSNLRHQ